MAKSPLDRAVTSKNLGTAAGKLATFAAFQDRERIELIVFYFTRAAQALLKALVSGCHATRPEWQEGVHAKLSRLAEDYMRYLVWRTDDWKIRVSMLHKLATQLPTEPPACRTQGAPVLATIKLYELSELVRVADAALDDGKENGWKRAGSALADAERPRVEAEQALARAATLPRAVWASTAERRDELELGWALAHRRAEVAQHLALAASERAAIFNDEAFDLDRCWRIVDLLGTAMRAARGGCHRSPTRPTTAEAASEARFTAEGEAIATAELGVFYATVIKDDGRARKLLNQAMVLADVVTHVDGRSFFHVPWYQKAKEELERLRLKNVAIDEEAVRAARAPMMQKLKPQLDAIAAAEGTRESKRGKARALLAYLLEHHPPKIESTKETLREKIGEADDDDANLKKLQKALLAAARAYHTDKIENKRAGMEWRILTEEIVKKVNYYHTELKGFG